LNKDLLRDVRQEWAFALGVDAPHLAATVVGSEGIVGQAHVVVGASAAAPVRFAWKATFAFQSVCNTAGLGDGAIRPVRAAVQSVVLRMQRACRVVAGSLVTAAEVVDFATSARRVAAASVAEREQLAARGSIAYRGALPIAVRADGVMRARFVLMEVADRERSQPQPQPQPQFHDQGRHQGRRRQTGRSSI